MSPITRPRRIPFKSDQKQRMATEAVPLDAEIVLRHAGSARLPQICPSAIGWGAANA